MAQHRLRQAAAEVDLALVHQTSEPDSSSLLGPIKAGLVGGQPVHLVLGDHPGGKALQEDFSDGHEKRVTNSLHPGAAGRQLRFVAPQASH